MKSGDPVEQEKQLEYATLVANTIVLSNVADLTEVLSAMSPTVTPSRPNSSPRPAPICAKILDASENRASKWRICRTRSFRSPCRSNCPCPVFTRIFRLPVLGRILYMVGPAAGLRINNQPPNSSVPPMSRSSIHPARR
nr:transposase [Bradyrhizobium sp. NAS80.1]